MFNDRRSIVNLDEDDGDDDDDDGDGDDDDDSPPPSKCGPLLHAGRRGGYPPPKTRPLGHHAGEPVCPPGSWSGAPTCPAVPVDEQEPLRPPGAAGSRGVARNNNIKSVKKMWFIFEHFATRCSKTCGCTIYVVCIH